MLWCVLCVCAKGARLVTYVEFMSVLLFIDLHDKNSKLRRFVNLKESYNQRNERGTQGKHANIESEDRTQCVREKRRRRFTFPLLVLFLPPYSSFAVVLHFLYLDYIVLVSLRFF